MRDRDLVTLGILAAIAWLLAWLFRRKLTPVVTSKIVTEGPVEGPSLPGGGFSTGGTRYTDIVIGDALEAWKGIRRCPSGAHAEHDATNGRDVCVLDGYTLKDVQVA